ncbi:MAG: heavy metal-associated domain-containing protein [Nitrososphaeria archaeon]
MLMVSEGLKSKTIFLEGPLCYSCVKRLIENVKLIENVVDAKVNIVAGILIIYFKDKIDVEKVRSTIEGSGFNFIATRG